MSKTIVTGLDVGSAMVRVVVCELSTSNSQPRILALVRSESHGLKRGYVVNIDETSESIRRAIKEAEQAARIKIKNVFAGIGGATLESKNGDSQIMISRPDAEISDHDVNRALELTEADIPDLVNSRIIHTIPLWYKLDGKKILGRPDGMHGSKLEARVLFVTCLNQHLQNLIAAIEGAGLGIEDMIASPIAMSLPILTAQQKNVGCVVANIGAETTSLIVYEDGIPILVETLPLGSIDITNDIALGLQLPLEEAERVKVNSEHAPSSIKRKLEEIIDARLAEIFEHIENRLKKIGRNGLLPAGILLAGGGSQLYKIEQAAKENLKLPAKNYRPNIVDPRSRAQVRDSSFLAAYGLCLFGLGTDVEETLTNRAIKHTKYKFLKWLRELLP